MRPAAARSGGPNLGGIALSLADTALLLGAGVLAGVVGSAGGITSLVSYPALLAVGISPLAANMTNAVSLAASWPGSTLGSRPELRGQGPWLRRWMPLAAAGGVAGSALLLLTPAGTFGRIVPYLLVLASLLLLGQPRISAWRENNLSRHDRWLLPAGLFAVALYVGYFGAGGGVMVLALLLLTVDQQVARANALKNVLLGFADVFAAVAFALFGAVHWTAAAPLAVGVLAGSAVGPAVARRLPGNLLRMLVALTGIGLAVHLWLSPV